MDEDDRRMAERDATLQEPEHANGAPRRPASALDATLPLGDGRAPQEDPFDGSSPFPPIADFAFLSDCEVNALVAPTGNIEWMCLPRPDAPSVFGALLDRSGGGFRLGPTDVAVPAGRRYLPGTNVLETTWQTRTGWLIVRDALVVGPWYHDVRRSETHRRCPVDHEAENVLLRTVRCVNGTIELAMECEPVFDYGRLNARWEYTSDGYGRARSTAPGSDVELSLATNLRMGLEGRRARAQTTLREGDSVFVALGWGEHPLPTTWDEAADAMWRTGEFWRQWLNRGTFPDHPWRIYLQRSALTLKGLTYAPTGALLAAATTSLPETPGGERNWDYRYTWIRDATFTLWGLYTLGFDVEANDFFYWVADVADRDERLQIMYGVGGERTLDESTLEHLSGYEGARPVRIGNDAYQQDQHDVWGAVLDSVYLHTKSRDYMPEEVWPLLRRQVEAALERWREPDRGIWEVRGDPQHFTSSKLMCWVAADRGARLARLRGEDDYAKRWSAAADEIHDDICANAVDERGVFTQRYGADALDASNLLIPLVRFLAPDDPRVRSTVLAIADELTQDGLVLRYKVGQTDDGLSGEEGTFTICSFWLVSALAEIGQARRARELCEKLLSYASPLHLYAEELDPRTGRHLGNFPQAFTHLALINAVMHVVRVDQRGGGRGFTPPRGLVS
jgi:GH15 family glucan-1,4-alpha-glucosidase